MNRRYLCARVYKTFLISFVCVAGITGCSPSPEPTTRADSAKENIERHRIVSTTVALTEIMDKLELDLAGIPTSYKKLPERYSGVKEVGNPMKPDMEVIKMLKPTDILSVTTLQYDLDPLYRQSGQDVTFVNLESLEDMKNSILELGRKYGRNEQAQKIVEQFDAKVAGIQKQTERKKRPKVLILLGIPGSYLVATEHSYIGDLVRILGGQNVIQGQKVEFLASNTEFLQQQANPDIILRAAHGMPEEVVKMFDKEFKENDIWKHFNAVKQNRVYDLEERLFGTTGNLEVSEALDTLAKMLYP
ncbi:heme ABC transporter substrate-binding protein IsdE [Paenibacillus larvae]|nr:heme ABC transporter substrate-binding protein IsdE [Paenibacillus larvae]